ncbi:F-box/kelch-repeat protein At3g06240 [Linum grandiflorum]
MTTGGDNGNVTYFAEDIVRNILQWLPLASCIARFRCVSRFWQVLLSDLNFIRKIIFSQTSDDEKSLQVLITGIRDFTGNSSLLYSVYSYETLRPITVELSTPMDDGEYPRVVGCCNGIFCLAHTKRASNGNYVHSIILWNPTTSETKIVPPGPRHPCHSSRIGMFLRAQRIGFGYDPKTNDYKVVHVLEFVEGSTNDDNIYDYDPAEFYHGPTPLIFTEVYSLRKGSWKPLNVDAYSLESSWMHYMVDHKTIDLRQQWDTSRNEKCYWFRCKQSEGVSAVISFDMSTEVFELITIPQPTGLTHHYVEEVYWDDPSDPCGNRRGYEIEKTSHHEGCWEVRSCFMLKKGVLLVTFSLLCSKCDISRLPNDETWVLLNYEDAKSWTKLYTWSQPDRTPPSDQLEVWKDGTYICARSDIMSVCDFETSETIRKGMEIEGTVGQFQAHVFTPTQVSMSKLSNSSIAILPSQLLGTK